VAQVGAAGEGRRIVDGVPDLHQQQNFLTVEREVFGNASRIPHDLVTVIRAFDQPLQRLFELIHECAPRATVTPCLSTRKQKTWLSWRACRSTANAANVQPSKHHHQSLTYARLRSGQVDEEAL
jgi:hypothetical protein